MSSTSSNVALYQMRSVSVIDTQTVGVMDATGDEVDEPPFALKMAPLDARETDA